MINGVIYKKLEVLDEVLNELHSLGAISSKDLENEWRTRRAVERALQILVEVVIDVCQRILSIEGQAPATSARNAIERCEQLGVLRADNQYGRMVQFRNLVVHHYENVNLDFLVDIVNDHLDGFEEFKQDITDYAQNRSE